MLGYRISPTSSIHHSLTSSVPQHSFPQTETATDAATRQVQRGGVWRRLMLVSPHLLEGLILALSHSLLPPCPEGATRSVILAQVFAIKLRSRTLVEQGFYYNQLMYNYPQIIRHQKAEVSESKPTPRPSTASSLAETTGTTQSPKSPSVEQSIESAQVPTLYERWSEVDAKLPISCLDSQWQQELREIEWEHDTEVWESCPYD